MIMFVNAYLCHFENGFLKIFFKKDPFALFAVKDLGRDMMVTLLLQVPWKLLVEGIMILLVLLLEVFLLKFHSLVVSVRHQLIYVLLHVVG